MIHFEFPQPAPLLSLNSREHWASKARWTAMWRKAAWAAAYQTHMSHLPPCIVTLTLPVVGNRRRDPINFTPCLKAVTDGLVDANFWEDDDSRWVTTTEPRLAIGASCVVVELVRR